MAERICTKIAAEMFGGDPGLLDADLVKDLEAVDDLMLRYQGNAGLLNAEVVAMVVFNWQQKNPERSAYHYRGD